MLNNCDIENYLGERFCEMLPNGLPTLYKRISYEIISFLKDTDEKILFLHWPTEEFSNKPKKQANLWNEICDSVALAVRLSLNQNSKENFKFDLNEAYLVYVNKEEFYWAYPYCEGEKIKARFYKSNPVKRTIHGEKFNQTQQFLPISNFTNAEKDEILNKAQAIFKIDREAFKSQLNEGEKTKYAKWKKNCLGEIDKLAIRFETEFSTAAIYITPQPNLERAGRYVYPIVKSRLGNGTQNISSDIAVIIGDKAYGIIQDILDYVSKLIVFGTRRPSYLKGREYKTISFSMQEAYEYCSGSYHAPEFIEIEFPWLRDTLQSFDNIFNMLDDTERPSETDILYIKNYVKTLFSNINFTSKSLTWIKDALKDRFEKSTFLSDTAYDRLVEWVDSLNYAKKTNPKIDYVKESRAKLILNKKRSISRQLSRAKLDAGGGDLIVIDAPFHNRDSEDENPISAVMRYHLFDYIHAVYYKDIQMTQLKRTKAEIIRDPFFKTIDTQTISEDNNEESGNPFEDYYYNNTEEIDRCYRGQSLRAIKIEFTDGTSADINGDVILHNEDGISEIMDLKDINMRSGETITFYSCPVSFENIVRAHIGLPKGHDLQYYSNLWHDALQKFIDENTDEACESFCKTFKVTKAQLRNHINGSSKFLNNVRKFKNLLEHLSQCGYMSSEEIREVIAASQFMKSKHISFGVELKDAIFKHRISPYEELPDFLKNVLTKTNMTIEQLSYQSLTTKTIK